MVNYVITHADLMEFVKCQALILLLPYACWLMQKLLDRFFFDRPVP